MNKMSAGSMWAGCLANVPDTAFAREEQYTPILSTGTHRYAPGTRGEGLPTGTQSLCAGVHVFLFLVDVHVSRMVNELLT